MTFLIAALGIITVVLSITIGARFHKRHKNMRQSSQRLTLALALQLYGEAIIGLGTLVFAIAAHMGWLESWGEGTQSLIRFIMFLATAGTTIHLSHTVSSLD